MISAVLSRRSLFSRNSGQSVVVPLLSTAVPTRTFLRICILSDNPGLARIEGG
jgi:hypothetical protein